MLGKLCKWIEGDKVRQLMAALRGDAQMVLLNLAEEEMGCYHTLVSTLQHRFCSTGEQELVGARFQRDPVGECGHLTSHAGTVRLSPSLLEMRAAWPHLFLLPSAGAATQAQPATGGKRERADVKGETSGRLVSNLGPVELVMNTPSHHRVHHGRNSYCIDKNYAGTLIIWDRIFGTFAPEREKVIYGLTHPINTFEVLWVQFQHYVHIWNTLWDTPGIANKLSVIFKGPGWGPGKPRLGLPEELPEITGKEVPHNPSIPVALQAYVMLQFLLMLGIYQEMFASKAGLTFA
ncbi:UNVERIFIED_CONTAM: hypothetical protein FKN15_042899 [Acipenser sinensis]